VFWHGFRGGEGYLVLIPQYGEGVCVPIVGTIIYIALPHLFFFVAGVVVDCILFSSISMVY
jgi:hypothetical protein